MGNLPFISIIPWEIVMQWANLLILALLLKKFLLKPVKAMLDMRQAQVNEIYNQATELQSKAEAACTQYETQLRGAKAEAEGVIKNATQRAQMRSTQIVEDAEKKASDTIKKSQIQLEQDKKKAIYEIKSEISTMAVDIAQKVVEREIDPSYHRELIDSFIGSVGDEK